MKTLIALIVLMCGAAFAQDAVVVELSPTDAVKAKQLYEAKAAADKAWDDLYTGMAQRYPASFLRYGSFEFSKDFRFVVPKQAQNSGTIWSSGCMTFVPSSGTFTTPPSIEPPFGQTILPLMAN